MANSKLLVVLILSINSLLTNAGVSMHDPFYCYAQDPIRPQVGMFSSITSYETNRGHNMVDPNVSTCTPAKFWFVSRHGTRLQSRSELENIFANNERLHRDILSNYEAGRTSLCAADIALLRNWRFDPNITLEMEQQLTVAGWNEFQEMAQRYQAAFPTLLPSTYSHSTYLFRTTHTARTLGSMRAFADGLFGHNGYQQVIFENVPNPDPFLRPHDFCELLNEVRDDTTEPQAFIDGPEYQQMLSQVSAKLGFHGSRHLSFNDISILNNICKFEQIWHVNSTSPMCAAFSVANYEVLEYYDDLFFYYRYGYGHSAFRTLYENIYCYAMQDLLTFIASDNPSDQRAKLYGGHTATVQMLAVTLGLFEDDEHLTRHNFAQQAYRKWKTSVHAAKGTNLVVVKYDCGAEDNDILFLHSEVPLQIPGCQSNGICKQSFLMERFGRFLNANCAEMYCRNS
ncbi:multiple inositol polyphosphate phosphatase 1-like [Bradysia coprophila]|uniref:multiple inositol polyphosphate phosphatase 1-like n=1 Tax=Bradysia coprophila TaxID=38358 RepID=UPI00187DD7D8|nr:multiple inositol polyphosphate phosphatase 1-like [Bradysia coprophila]